MRTIDDPDLLYLTLRARRFDEKLLEKKDRIRGHWHVSIGLEATAAALGRARRPGDRVMTTYRNHAHLACLGSDLAVMFAEVFGRDLGPQRGRSGTFHLADADLGVLHTSAMVSGGVPIALGLAYALKRADERGMVFCFFGDGAFNEGALHESLNLVSLWELPVLLVCENNAAPRPDRANDMQSAPSLLALAEVNGVSGVAVDAREPAEVDGVMSRLADEVRSQGAPRFLEARAAQWPGNRSFLPTDATGPTDLRDALRPRGEPWFDADDPILNECRRRLAAGVELEDLLELDRRVSEEVASAFEASERAPIPPAEAALSDVFGEG